MTMTLAWIVVAVTFAVAEMLTLAFYAVFVSAGALAAAGAAAAGFEIVPQALVMGVVGLVGVVAVRPFLLRALRRPAGSTAASGAAEMVGRTAVVVDAVAGEDHPGHVSLLGERWPAFTADGSTMTAGQTVLVTAIRRATLVVGPAT